MVVLRGEASGHSTGVRTDATGRFEFLDLIPGTYILEASKAGYLAREFGADGPDLPGIPVVVAAGARRDDLTIVLERGAVVTGRVIDESGGAVAGAPVVLMQYREFGGRRQLAAMPGPWAVTDQSGDYRSTGIAPGDYLIAAYPPGDYRFIAPGQMPVPDGETRQVTDAEVAWARQQLASAPGGLLLGSEPVATGAAALPEGRRVVRVPVYYNLLPGRYAIAARSSDRALVASDEVLLTGADVTGLRLMLQPGARLSGRIELVRPEGSPPVDLGGVRIRMVRVSPGPSTMSAVTDASGGFTLAGVGAGHYQVQAEAGTSEVARAGRWRAGRVRANGIDVLGQGVDVAPDATVELVVTLEAAQTHLSGVVLDGDQVAVGWSVVALPARTGAPGLVEAPVSVRTATDGTFDVSGLPLGAYLVAAAPSIGPDQLRDPAFEQALRASGILVVFTADVPEHHVTLARRIPPVRENHR